MRQPHLRGLLLPGAFAGCIYLVWSTSSLLNRSAQPERTFVRSIDMAIIYSSQAMIDFAKASRIDEIVSHRQLALMLEEKGLGREWIGLTRLSYIDQGEPSDETVAYYPARDEQRFGSMVKALGLLKAETFRGDLGQIEPLRVVVPADMMDGDPMEVIAILQERSRAVSRGHAIDWPAEPRELDRGRERLRGDGRGG